MKMSEPFHIMKPMIYVLSAHIRQFNAVMSTSGFNRFKSHFLYVQAPSDLVAANDDAGCSYLFPLSGWERGYDAERMNAVLAVKRIPKVSAQELKLAIQVGALDRDTPYQMGLEMPAFITTESGKHEAEIAIASIKSWGDW